MKRGLLTLGIFVIVVILVDAGLVLNGKPSITGEVGKIFGSEDGIGLKEEKIVTKIIDGDTVIVEGGENVRLLGIDCDEKGHKCFTPAKKRIEELTLGKSAVLEQEGDDLDMYKRELRYIFIDGKNINLQLVAEGFCVARFEGDSKYKEEIQQAESDAIKNKIGCKWGS
ncbi:MAG: thermonuclease family protein [Candidatus Pacearchaeota archaeon]